VFGGALFGGEIISKRPHLADIDINHALKITADRRLPFAAVRRALIPFHFEQCRAFHPAYF